MYGVPGMKLLASRLPALLALVVAVAVLSTAQQQSAGDGRGLVVRHAADIPPFNVTGFYGQVLSHMFENSWWYWIEFNVTIRPGEGQTSCAAWQTTSSSTTIDTSIPVTACRDAAAVFWAFTVGEGSYGLMVGWNESMYSILQGNTTIRGTDFMQGRENAVPVVFYNGAADLTLPVTQINED